MSFFLISWSTRSLMKSGTAVTVVAGTVTSFVAGTVAVFVAVVSITSISQKICRGFLVWLLLKF